jgi:hypothetical protein
MTKSDLEKLYESIGNEIYSKKNRIRNIIGDSHCKASENGIKIIENKKKFSRSNSFF